MFDNCFQAAQSIQNDLKNKGQQATLIQVAGYRGDVTRADSRWRGIPPAFWHHYVTVSNGIVYDPTVLQYDPFRPTEYSVDQLKKDWSELYLINY